MKRTMWFLTIVLLISVLVACQAPPTATEGSAVPGSKEGGWIHVRQH